MSYRELKKKDRIIGRFIGTIWMQICNLLGAVTICFCFSLLSNRNLCLYAVKTLPIKALYYIIYNEYRYKIHKNGHYPLMFDPVKFILGV